MVLNLIRTVMPQMHGPPKIGPPGPSAAKHVAVDGPPGPSMAAIDGPPDQVWLP